MDAKVACKKISTSFEKEILSKLSDRLKSFYLVGSYAFGKTSEQRPDINYLLIFDKFTTPKDYFQIGKICKSLEKEFSRDVMISIEFRPFRYIKPRYKQDIMVSINPIIISTGEIEKMGGVIFNKWFTEGLKSANKLITGDDFLQVLKPGTITKQDLMKGAGFDLNFFTIPVSRAPAQYSDEESHLLLNESLVNAKNISYFGVEAAMSEKELADKSYLEYMKNKNTIVSFYEERYGKDTAKSVERVFQVRRHYQKYKNDPAAAEEMFGIALALGNAVRSKVFS